MAYITEANECHPKFLKEAFDRTLSSRNRKIFHDLNPKEEEHWYYTDILGFHEKKQADNPLYGYNYGHFTLVDNMSLTNHQIRKLLGTWGCREIAIFPLFRTKRRIPWESCDLSHLFPRGVLLILFVLSLLYYFYAHKKNIRFLFYELFFMLFSHLFFLRIFSTFHEGIDDICLYFGQLHTA